MNADPRTTGKIITKTVLVLSVVSLFADVASEMLYPVIPMYLQSIGFGVLFIGILEAIAVSVSGLTKGMFGQWSDHSGRRMVFVRWGYLLSAIAKPLMAVSSFPLAIVAARSLDRLGKGARTAPRDAMLSHEATPETKARVFGFHRSLDTLGAVIGPAIALWFLSLYPTQLRAVFYYAFIPGILAVLITFLVKETRSAPDTNTTKRPGMFSYFSYWRRAPLRYKQVFLPMTLFTLFNSSDMFLLLRVHDVTSNSTTPVLAYILFNIVYAASSYVLGHRADRKGMKGVVLLGLFSFVVCYALMATTPSLPIIAVAFCIYGISVAATDGTLKAWLSNMVDAKEVGTGLGLFASMQSIAVFVASTTTGVLWQRFGAPVSFSMSAAAALLALVWLSSMPKRSEA